MYSMVCCKRVANLCHSELSGSALAALQEFYTERDDRQKRFEELKSAAEDRHSKARLSMELFTEDWNASQFWVGSERRGPLGTLLIQLVQRRDSHHTSKAAPGGSDTSDTHRHYISTQCLYSGQESTGECYLL